MEAKSTDDDVQRRFLEDVVDIGNRDMTRVNIKDHVATINGTHYTLPEYANIELELNRMREARRFAMAELQWQANRLIYDMHLDTDRARAAFVALTSKIKQLDDAIIALRAVAALRHKANTTNIKDLKAEVASIFREAHTFDNTPAALERIAKTNALQRRLKEATDLNIPILLYAKTRVSISSLPAASPTEPNHNSVRQQVGGRHTTHTTSVATKQQILYQSVKDKLILRRARNLARHERPQ